MNRNQSQTGWSQFKGSVKAAWNKVDDYSLYLIAGDRDRPAGKSRETYWISRAEVEKLLAERQVRQKDIDHSVSRRTSGDSM